MAGVGVGADGCAEDEELVERALSAIALRLDGKTAAATVARRKRAVFHNALELASTGQRRLLARNPLSTMKWKPPEVAEKVDRRVIANSDQIRELLTALTYVGSRDRDRAVVSSPCLPACTSRLCDRPRR